MRAEVEAVNSGARTSDVEVGVDVAAESSSHWYRASSSDGAGMAAEAGAAQGEAGSR